MVQNIPGLTGRYALVIPYIFFLGYIVEFLILWCHDNKIIKPNNLKTGFYLLPLGLSLIVAVLIWCSVSLKVITSVGNADVQHY